MKILIFDHSKSKAKIEKAMTVVAKYSSVPLTWNIIELAPDNARFEKKETKKGYYAIDKAWFRDTYSVRARGYDFCVAYFSKTQWKKLQKKNKSAAESVEHNYGVSEIALSGSLVKRSSRPLAPKVNESEFVVRLLHEMCHGMFDHKLKVKDVTHEYHYEKKNLLDAIKLWNKKKLTNREKLYVSALVCLGKDATPNDLVPDELACAETVNAIHKYAFWFEIGGGASTYQMYKALLSHKDFIKVDQPMAGDIVISPTGYGNGKLSNGHVGIVGANDTIMSNSSKTGTFESNYTLVSWKKRYVTLGGYPMHYFRRV